MSAGKTTKSVYTLNKAVVEVPNAGNGKVALSLYQTEKTAKNVYGPRSLPTPATIGIRNSSGTNFDVPLTVRNSAGTSFTVDNFVRNSGGTEFRVT